MTESTDKADIDIHDLIIQVWQSAFGAGKITYLSGPITTGRRLVRWYRETGLHLTFDSVEYKSARLQAVIKPNSEDIIIKTNELRTFWPEPVLEPATMTIRNWSQDDYLRLWKKFIEIHASRILFMPDWEYSVGCVTEFHRAIIHKKSTVTFDGSPIVLRDGITLVEKALIDLRTPGSAPALVIGELENILLELKSLSSPKLFDSSGHLRKDASLDRLAETINVAQFVSYEPDNGKPKQAFSRIREHTPNQTFSTIRHAAEALLNASTDTSVNVRSYTPTSPLSREFIYGLTTVDDVVAAVNRLTTEGLHTIINETVDVNDGGVSGVLMGDILEFSPDDTPRCVEKPGICSLPLGMGMRLLASVYGFNPELAVPRASRLEFSLHPKPRGWRHTHTLGWEYDSKPVLDVPARITWPNRFSRMIGDKVFGLLIAHEIGLPVPRTTVISRRIAPFSFGRSTTTDESWLRTAPNEQMPGKFTTTRGWIDPFYLLAEEDPDRTEIASVLAQSGVHPLYSGASIVLADGTIQTEGRVGAGDVFMLGVAKREELPFEILEKVADIHRRAALLGHVRFEWVYDGNEVWVVQLHRGATVSDRSVLVPGEADRWENFDVADGLPALRAALGALRTGTGLHLSGEVGLTSHIADVVRMAGVPARIV